MSFAQGAPTQPLVLQGSNVFLYGSSTAGNAFTVQQLGAGNVASFQTSTGSAALVINPTGLVGIGKTNPGYALDVTGDLNFTGTFRQNGTAYIGSQWTGTSTLFFVGNVGINTTSVANPLTVGGTAVITTLNLTNALGTTYGGTGLSSFTSGGLLYASSTSALASSGAYTAGQVLYGGGAGAAPGSSSGLFYDSANSRLGIGTTNPAVALDIISTNAGIRVQEPNYGITTRIISEVNYNGSNRWWLLATFSYSSYHIFDVDANLSRIDSAPCDVKFGFAGAYSSSVATQISRSENRGTVGNGYFQAWYNSTTGVIDVWLFATSFTPTMLTMKYYNAVSANLTANWTTSAPTTSATYVKQWDTSVNSTYTQLSGGNVGIGTTNPSYTLQVAGSVGASTSFTRTTPSTGVAFAAPGTGLTATSYNLILVGGNDTGDKLVVFVNGSTRTADGGVSNVTIRNDGGSLILGNASFPTIVYGNVGIGTTNPLDPLHVRSTTSTARLTGTTNFTTSAFIFDNKLGDYWHSNGYGNNPTTGARGAAYAAGQIICGSETNNNYENAYMAFQVCFDPQSDGIGGLGVTTERMRIKSNGNVGIGRTDPPYKFSVDNGSTTGPAAFVQASGITAGQTTSFILGKANSTNNSGTILWNHVGDGLATNYLGLGYWGGDNKLNITAAGNVGIGKTNPGTALDVNGTVTATTFSGSAASLTSFPTLNQNTTGSAASLSGTPSTSVSPLYILGATAAPSWDTLSDAAQRTNTYIAFNAAGANNDWAYLRQIGGDNVYEMAFDFHDDGSDCKMSWRDITSTAAPDNVTTRMRLDGGALFVSGDITAFNSFSDARLKEDVVNIENCLDKVQELRPVEFTWKQDIRNNTKRGKRDVGLIAQEAFKVFPLAHNIIQDPDTNEDIHTLKYERFVPLLIGALKEEKAKRESLELRLERLEKLLGQQ